jgi:DNA primase
VASLGTSLTPEQARLMSRYVNEVVIAYDNDGAGQKAAQRAITILEKLDMRVRVLRMEGATDPDEFLAKFGADAFRNLLEKSENHVEYRLDSLKANFDLSSDEQKVAYLKEAADIVAQLPGAVEREVYAMRLSEQTGVPKAAVTDEVARRRRQRLRRAKKEQQRTELRPAHALQNQPSGVKYADPRSAAAEEGIVRLAFLDPGLFRTGTPPDAALFSVPELRHIYEALLQKALRGEQANLAALSAVLTPQEVSLLTGLIQKPAELANGAKALSDYIDILKTQRCATENADDLRALAERLKEKKGYGG